MKTPSFFKKSIYSALVFFGTLIMLSAGYATWNATMAKVSSGSTLSSDSWNALVDNISDLDSRWSRNGLAIGFTGGNVGIGTVSPGAELQVQNSLTTGTPTDNAGMIIKSVNRNAYLQLDGISTSGESVVFHSSGVEKWRIAYYNSTNSLSFFSNTAERMGIDSNGNIAIGNVTPATNTLRYFDVYNTDTGTSAGANIRIITKDASGAGTSVVDLVKYKAGGFNIMNSETSTSGFIGFSVGGTERAHIDSTGNMGIGTATPAYKLDVNGSARVAGSMGRPLILGDALSGGGLTNQGDVGGWAFWYHAKGSSGTDRGGFGFNGSADVLGYYYIGSSYANATVYIQPNNGNVGIGIASPGYKLQVNGSAAGTSWTNTSDQRFKKNITPITSGLDTIDKLQWVTFDWKRESFPDRNFPAGRQIGFIAQDVEKVLPELVTSDAEGYKWVQYANITAVLVEAVKELKKENAELKTRLETVEKR